MTKSLRDILDTYSTSRLRKFVKEFNQERTKEINIKLKKEAKEIREAEKKDKHINIKGLKREEILDLMSEVKTGNNKLAFSHIKERDVDAEDKVLEKMQVGLNKMINNYRVNKDNQQLKKGVEELIAEAEKAGLDQYQSKKKMIEKIKEVADKPIVPPRKKFGIKKNVPILEIVYNESTKKYSIKPPPKQEPKKKEVKIEEKKEEKPKMKVVAKTEEQKKLIEKEEKKKEPPSIKVTDFDEEQMKVQLLKDKVRLNKLINVEINKVALKNLKLGKDSKYNNVYKFFEDQIDKLKSNKYEEVKKFIKAIVRQYNETSKSDSQIIFFFKKYLDKLSK